MWEVVSVGGGGGLRCSGGGEVEVVDERGACEYEGGGGCEGHM